MALSDIVNVTISRVSTTTSRVGFGTPLVLGAHSVFGERARVYTGVTGLTDDGFTDATPASGVIADPILTAVRTIFAQQPRPQQVIVGRVDVGSAPAHAETLTIASVVADTDYEVTVNGNTATFDSGGSPTAATISAGLTAAIDALPGGADDQFNATDGVGTITMDSGASNGAHGLFEMTVGDRSLITRKNTTSDPGISAELTAIQAFNDDWYAVIPTSISEAEINALATAIEAQRRMLVVSSADDDIPANTTGNIGDDLNPGFARSTLLYNTEPWRSPHGAWAGRLLPTDPGSATWKFKTLATITPTEDLTATELTNLEATETNWYQTVAGKAITCNGTGGSGEFNDITRFVDFITQRLEESVFGALSGVDKVSFTDQGIGIIENAVREVMALGVSVGGFTGDPFPVVTVPKAADVSAANKAARTLPDVTFTANLAGAIHEVVINGTISV